MPVPYIDAASRTRLNDVKERRAEIQRQINRTNDHLAAVKKAMASMDFNGSASDVQNSHEFQQAERLTNELTDLRLKMKSVEQEETYLLGRMAGVEGVGERENFFQDPHTLEELRLMANSSEPIGRKTLGEAMSRDEMLAYFEHRRQSVGGDGFGGGGMAAAGDVTVPGGARTRFYGITPQLRRRLSILDLMPTAPMDTGAFDYLQETGSLDTGPAETADLAVKPSAVPTLVNATVTARTIPAWTRLSKPQIQDVPALQTTVETRLLYMVQRRLENQILAGAGDGNNLLGIVHTTGIGAPASVANVDTTNSDLVLNALGSVLSAEAEPNAAVLNPTDAIRMFKTKAASSGLRLDSQGAFSDLPQTIWGLPLILSTAVAAGNALVGDFAQGGTVFIRQGLTTLVSDADGNDFTENAVKVLVEMRAGLAIWRPACFAYVPLGFAD